MAPSRAASDSAHFNNQISKPLKIPDDSTRPETALAALRRDIARLAETMRELLEHQPQAAGLRVSEAVADARDKIASTATDAQNRIRAASGDIEASIERNALIVVLIAFIVGMSPFAAYIYPRALEGRVVAALIGCAACALLAITIGVIGAVRQRSARLNPAAAVSAPASRGNVDSLLQHLAAAGSAQDQQALDAAGTQVFADAASGACADRRFRRREKTHQVSRSRKLPAPCRRGSRR